jgi:acetylornithine deacetylase/succinyl-diaminopimelate desuccinylase-like protein
MNEIFNFIEQNRQGLIDELFELLAIPSISSQSEHKEDCRNCALWVVNSLKSIGITDVRVMETEGHPIVYAHWNGAGADAPTVLVYGHYDVQPVDPLDLWTTKPFEPEIRNGKIFARGSADDKGQFYVHIKALEALFKLKGKAKVNIKFLIEGEEEASVSHLDEFIINNAELLKCDTVLVSDSEWFAPGMPSICYGLRGIAFFEIKVTGPNRDLHSGSFGGGVDNPLQVLCWMITQLKDKYGRITIPNFYDDVVQLTKEEREGFEKLPFNLEEYCKDLDIETVNGEIGYTTLERVWARPALDVNGIWGGYTGEGSKTILPTCASAKISIRLVPNQNPDEILKNTEKYLKSIAPPTVKISLNMAQGGKPVLVRRDSAGVKAAMKAFRLAFNMEPVFMREGGSIPIVELFDSVLHAPTVLMGFGLPSDNIHSPNENYDVENYIGGIKTSAAFFEEFIDFYKK